MKNKVFVISLSPAIDYILKLDDLKKGETNRPKSIDMYAAGKGIHVSMILNNFEIENESLVFAGGDFENYFYKNLDENHVNYQKFQAEGQIRINLKLIDQDQTECSVASPKLAKTEIDRLKKYLNDNVSVGDYVVLTGSIPTGVDQSIYAQLVKLTNELGGKAVVDSFGESLNLAVTEKPFLIKPNIHELASTLNREIKTNKEAIECSKELLKKGVENILISMGGDGAMFVNNEHALKASLGDWNYKLVNAAGAGDSMLGGFISKFIESNDFTESLRNGIVCGSATAFSNRIASKELIHELKTNETSIKIINLN